MTYEQLVEHFGTPELARRALCASRGYQITRQALTYWKRTGVPRGVQAEFQILTGGKLQANSDDPKVAA